ncbi:MAG TPA: hypothetical protein VH276_09060 [Solirubrobacteraceae bacterium]|jgi:hypothetical protein|nr:hypothetical protein [Solirubrobacteraceae bacterium]
MPVPPAELTAHFTIDGPDAARAAAVEAAGPSGLARHGGPGETLIAGPRAAVLAALGDAVQAALAAGAHALDVRLEAPTESR